jgi:hypothetical protein
MRLALSIIGLLSILLWPLIERYFVLRARRKKR